MHLETGWSMSNDHFAPYSVHQSKFYMFDPEKVYFILTRLVSTFFSKEDEADVVPTISYPVSQRRGFNEQDLAQILQIPDFYK
jgi:hypothetical protein